MPDQALASFGPLLVADLEEDFAVDHQGWVGIPAAYQTVQEDLVACSCHLGIEIAAHPATEVAALLVTEVAALLVTEVVALLVTGGGVLVPSAVPWDEEDLDGREGPSEGPSAA
ncbi:hypothetical protein J7T55_012729 [Diaporthe amygdali]|uniref:uncharacterized protein n=1 Tax=Phomopsis amygdali TaxID=1214568 RepID=UPI0022FDDC8E|nr:uncharacterized protein J7T55_012729 [Diaporthe amygdali]KAJ0115449.1 hypothetical protein J7T55_012729 [Diaporthe amygdali]